MGSRLTGAIDLCLFLLQESDLTKYEGPNRRGGACKTLDSPVRIIRPLGRCIDLFIWAFAVGKLLGPNRSHI